VIRPFLCPSEYLKFLNALKSGNALCSPHDYGFVYHMNLSMKKLLFCLLLFAITGASAQTTDFSKPSFPALAFDQLKLQYPYIRTQKLGADWTDYQLHTHRKSPNLDTIGLSQMWWWTDNQWNYSEVVQDSFVLNNAGKVRVHYSTRSNYYKSDTFAVKYRYIYDYQSGNTTPYRVKVEYAEPPTSNNYLTSSHVYFFYDQSGRKLRDSVLFSSRPTVVDQHIYDDEGKLMNIFGISNGDTVSKAYLTYSGNNLATYTLLWPDEATDGWKNRYADTIEYNEADQPVMHLYWGMLYRSGDPEPVFTPLSKELYHYNTSGKIDEYITITGYTGSWIEGPKTTIEYDQNNRPLIAYQYDKTSEGWSNTAFTRHLFAIPTGLHDNITSPEARIYPNPSNEQLGIELTPETKAAFTRISLHDISGKCVYTSDAIQPFIPTADLHNGLYFLTLTTHSGSVTQKVMVQH
jgi:hypothetical protein